MKDEKAIIILSGGIDSITLLYEIVKEHKAKNITAISFKYGSRHNMYEIPMAGFHCTTLKVEHIIIDVISIFNHFHSALLKGGESIPEGHYEDDNMKKTVVPFRNGILLSIAVGMAESKEATKVYYGAHSGDHAIYPDCRSDFVRAISQASWLGTFNKVQILAPYTDISKAAIIGRGLELKINYLKTHTCYNPSLKGACGKCGSCIERCQAFMLNDKKDPIKYRLPWSEQKAYTLSVLEKK